MYRNLSQMEERSRDTCFIPELPEQCHALLDQGCRPLVVTLPDRYVSGLAQRLCTQALVGRRAGLDEPPFQPATSLALAVGMPEACLGQRSRQPEPQLRALFPRFPFDVLRAQRPSQGGPEIVVFGPQPLQPRRLLPQLGLGLLGESQVVPRVPLPDQFRLSRLVELLGGVLPRRLQKPVACLPAPAGYQHQRLLHQPYEHVENFPGVDAIPGAYGLGRIEGEPFGEHGKPPEYLPFFLVEQLVAPVQGASQRPLPLRSGPVSAGEQTERILQPARDLLDREGPHPRRRELYGEGHAVQPTAHLRHRRGVILVEGEVRDTVASPLHEQFTFSLLFLPSGQSYLDYHSMAGAGAARDPGSRADYLPLPSS